MVENNVIKNHHLLIELAYWFIHYSSNIKTEKRGAERQWREKNREEKNIQ